MTAIVLYDIFHAIAKRGKQIATIRSDLIQFRKLTMGHVLIMGTKTAKIIGHPLRGRLNVVVTHDLSDEIPFFDVYPENNYPERFIKVNANDLKPILEIDNSLTRDFFVIGGEYTYAAYLPYTDLVIATEIKEDLCGDQFFPQLVPEEWSESYRSNMFTSDDGYQYQYAVYSRHNFVRDNSVSIFRRK